MTDDSNLVIRPLDSEHARSGFHCGIASLDDYIQKQARQDVKRCVSRVFVATTVKQSNSIIGYYTLSTLSIELSQLPQELARKLPRHPVPSAFAWQVSGKSGGSESWGGEMLLVNAIKRTLAVSNEIAIYAMVVDAISAGSVIVMRSIVGMT